MKSYRFLAAILAICAVAAAQGLQWSSFKYAEFSGFHFQETQPATGGYRYTLSIDAGAEIHWGGESLDVTQLMGFYALRGYPVVDGSMDKTKLLANTQGDAFIPAAGESAWAFGYDGNDSGEVVGWSAKANGIRLDVPIENRSFTFTQLNRAAVVGFGFDLQYRDTLGELKTGYFKCDAGTPPNSVPEPFTMGLLAAGLGMAALARRRKA